MQKKQKLILFIVIGVLSIGLYPLTNQIAHNKVVALLKDEPNNLFIKNYEDLKVNIWKGKLQISNVDLEWPNENELIKNTIKTESIYITGFKLMNYWLHKEEIKVKRIEIVNPEVQLVSEKPSKEEFTDNSKSAKKPPKINAKEVSIKNLVFAKRDENGNLQTKFKLVDATFKNLNIEDWETPSTWYNDLENYTIKIEDLYHKATDWEAFRTDKIELTETIYKIQNLHFYTELNKKEYRAKLPRERDHYNVEIPNVEISSFQWNTHEDRQRLFVSKAHFDSPKINIYRDKLLPDDNSIKPLFSQLLRELRFDIQTEEITLRDANITYTERVQEENSGGSVYFSEFNAVISDAGNFENINKEKDIKIEVETTFMKTAKLTTDWRFNPQEIDDSFHFQARISHLDANHANLFTEPNLFVKMNGSIDLLYLNIHGNRNASNTDFAISYHDLKVELLNKRGRDKLKVISAIANIFVRKNTKTDDSKLQEAKVKVERDQTKSIFNFLWKNTLEGLKETIVTI